MKMGIWRVILPGVAGVACIGTAIVDLVDDANAIEEGIKHSIEIGDPLYFFIIALIMFGCSYFSWRGMCRARDQGGGNSHQTSGIDTH